MRLIWIDFYLRRSKTVSPIEVTTRFFRHQSDYRVKPTLRPADGFFLPHKDQRTSIFLIRRLRPRQIWFLGESVVSAAGNTLYGRADVTAADIYELDLQLQADSMFRRHVNIAGWPEHKGDQKLRALKLAQKMSRPTLYQQVS